MNHQPLRPIVALVIALLAAAPAIAQVRRNTNVNNNNRNYPGPIDRSASSAARKTLTEQETAVSKAQRSMTDAATGLERTFNNSGDWQNAQTALKQAQTAYDAACRPLREELASRPAYKAALAEKSRAEAKRDALAKSDPPAGIEERTAAATEVMNAGNILTRMEAEAFKNSSDVQSAREKLVQANQRCSELKAQFDTSLKGDPAWQAAKKDLDAARDKAAAARKTLNDALEKERVAERERNRQIAEIDRKYQEEENRRRQEEANRNPQNRKTWRR